MPALLVFAATNNRLNGYGRGDIIQILPANWKLSDVERANDPVMFGFVYVTGVGPNHPQLQALTASVREDDSDDDSPLLAKRAWRVPVAAIGAAATTYREFDDPDAVKYTALQLQTAATQKTRAEAVTERVGILTSKREAVLAHAAKIQTRIDTLNGV